MRKKVLEFIQKNELLQPGDRVVVGVSGGADSVGLLRELWELREELGIHLRAVHVHHGLRGAEADRDAAFVQKLCARLNVDCQVVHEDVRGYAAEQGLSEEEAGRMLRYRSFEEAVERWKAEPDQGTPLKQDVRYRIAVAHHREDQAETILHNLFRGSGLKGLGGMAPVRGDIIRPLLCVSKKEILEYLREQGIGYCEDSTNGSSDYTRNKLRNQLIPQICQEINGGAVEHIVSAGERLAQADAYFEGEAARIWAGHGLVEADSQMGHNGGRCGIRAADLLAQPEILQGYLIRHMIYLQCQSMKDITSRHICQIQALAQKETGRSISLPYGLKAWIEYGVLWITKEAFQEAVDNQADRQTVGQKVPQTLQMSHFHYEKSQKIPQNQYTKWFDYDKIKGALSVRTRKTGDFITLTDGKHKTVKSYMIDEKIPRQERDRILLLVEGSHVLWIVGYRISEYYKVTEETEHILQVQADGGEEHGR